MVCAEELWVEVKVSDGGEGVWLEDAGIVGAAIPELM